MEVAVGEVLLKRDCRKLPRDTVVRGVGWTGCPLGAQRRLGGGNQRCENKDDRIWTSDITYVSTREGWLYLVVVLDLASRRVAGWAVRETLERELVLAALSMALTHRQPDQGVLHHSDRGSQYASADYRSLLTAHGLEASMSRRGDCWDNAVTESFFATFKVELVYDVEWGTRDQARRDIFEFIEIWYNRERRHSSLGYCTPVEYEQMLERKPLHVRRAA